MGDVQKGPFPVAGSITRGPISPRKHIAAQTPEQKIHRPLPMVLFSEAQALDLCPPANNKKVCRAMTKDHIDDATSPTLIKKP